MGHGAMQLAVIPNKPMSLALAWARPNSVFLVAE
jgi:hypothetical protein